MKRLSILAFIMLYAFCAKAQAPCPTPTSTSITFCAVVYASLNPGGVQAAQVGIAFSQTYTSPNMASTAIAAGGGSPTQNGLTVNVGSGTSFTVTGTPTAQANSQWKIAVTYSNGTSATFTVAVQAGAATGVMVNPATANVNQTQTQQFTATELFSNGTTANVTSSATWTLPTCAATGSTVSAGLFTGGGTAGSCTVEAAVSTQNGTATVTVPSSSSPLSLQSTTLPNGQINQPYPETPPSFGQGFQILVSGGTAPYTYSACSGFPTGLSVSASGLVSGTPTSSGVSSSATCTITDAASNHIAPTWSITVASLTTSLTVNVAATTLTANTGTTSTVTGNYSDSTTAGLPLSAGIVLGTPQYGLNTSSSPTATVVTNLGDTVLVDEIDGSGGTNHCPLSTPTLGTGQTAHAATTCIGPSSGAANTQQLWYFYNVSASSANVVTGGLGYVIAEPVTGLTTTDPLDSGTPSPVFSASASGCVPNSLTTTQAYELLVEGCSANAATGYTPPTGWNPLLAAGAPDFLFSVDSVSAIQTSITPTITYTPGSQPMVVNLAAFKAQTPAAGSAQLSSSNAACFAVSASGKVTALPVSVQCTGTVNAVSGSASGSSSTITVNPSSSNTDQFINVTPTSVTLPINGSQQFCATGNSTGNTYTAQWGTASSNGGAATLGAQTGTCVTATATAAGAVTINATVSGFTTVNSATLNIVSGGSGTLLNASNCNPTGTGSISATLTNVVSGAYTLVIPSGTCSWTTGFSFTLPSAVTSLTLEGATTVNCTGTPGTSTYACTPSDSTIIEDAYQSNNPLITIAASTPQALRISGITIEGGNVGSGSCGAPSGKSSCSKFAMINVSGTHNLRIDHIHCDTTTYTPISGINSACVRMYSETEGVLDHNYIFMGNNSSVQNGFQFFNTIGDNIGQGDGGWTVPTAFGTSAFLFAEDNVFVGGASNDCNNAGRFVMRYNTMNDEYLAAQNHSIKYYGGREQGCRASEIYHNYFTGPTSGQTNAAIGLNGGPAMIWGNNDAQGYFHLFASGTERGNSGQTEQPAPGSWGYCGTAVNSNGQGSGWDGNDVTTTGWPCLDGLGRGQMLLPMNGQNFPTAAANGCIPQSPPTCSAWPNQELEPMYLFMNTVSSGDEGYTNSNDAVWNRDVYSDCGSQGSSTGCGSAFNGTAGTGFGLLSARPSTCTAGQGGTYAKSPTGSYGVGYWATDTQTFYACTSTNTWTAIYSPYTYPHPLDGDKPN